MFQNEREVSGCKKENSKTLGRAILLETKCLPVKELKSDLNSKSDSGEDFSLSGAGGKGHGKSIFRNKLLLI